MIYWFNERPEDYNSRQKQEVIFKVIVAAVITLRQEITKLENQVASWKNQ